LISLRIQTLTLPPLARGPPKVQEHINKRGQVGLKPALVEKCWLAASIVTCTLGLAVGSSFFQFRVHIAISYLPSFPGLTRGFTRGTSFSEWWKNVR